MKRTISFILALLLVSVSLMSLYGCSGETSTLHKISPTAEEKKVVGNVAEYEVMYDELRFLTMNFRETLKEKYGDDIWNNADSASQYRSMLEAYVKEAIIKNAAALKTVADYGVEIDEKAEKNYIAIQLNELASDLVSLISEENPSKSLINETYEQYLEGLYLTDRYNRYVMSVDAHLEQFRLKLIEDGTLINDDEAFSEYIKSNYVHILHVYIPKTSYESDEAALSDAELVKWILDTNFIVEENRNQLKVKLGITEEDELSDASTSMSSTVAIKFYNRLLTAKDRDEKMNILIGSSLNKDLSISQSGYYFTHFEYEESYEKAAFALELNEISNIVYAEDGYYIIWRLPLDDSYINTNFDLLKSQYHTAYINKLISDTTAKVSFEFNDYGKSIDLTTIK